MWIITLAEGEVWARARKIEGPSRLVRSASWMEQEALVLDPRLPAAIELATRTADLRPGVARTGFTERTGWR